MWSRLLLLASIGLLGCGAATTNDVGPPAPSATASAATTAVGVGVAATSATSAPAASGSSGLPGPAATAAASAVVTAGPPPATTVSSATGAPAGSASATVPGAPPTADELKVIAMCQGKADIFTDKEKALLIKADASGNTDLHEAADAIRTRRKESLNAACERLRAAGKL